MSPYISVKKSTIHSTGVFAKKNIPTGARVIEYVGEKLTKAVSQIRADVPLNSHKKNKLTGAVYIFELNKRYDIDGLVPHNTARYINHSCAPNCETDIIRGKIYVISIVDIKKGDEITYDYGYDLDEDYEEHICHCNAKNCVGYIVKGDHWKRLQKMIEKKKKK